MESQVFRRVLIPIEDPDFVELVVDFVKNFRWTVNTQFKVLHVNEAATVLPSLGGVPVILPESVFEEELAQSRRLVDSVVAKLELPNTSVEGFIEDGQAREVILRYAREWPADLIVMASHDRHGFDKWLMGSVSGTIADNAPCPTFILHSKNRLAA